MNKIENAIKGVHHIDNNAYNDMFLNKVHPLVKLVITIFYIVVLTSIKKYNLTQTIAMSVYLFGISVLWNLSIKDCIKRLKPIFLLLIFVGIANPILDRNIIAYIGIIPITTGIISMITLVLKAFFAVIATYFLISTTSIENICFSLKMLHIPNIIIIIVMLIYRYIIIFLKEVERIWTAYSMRAPEQKGVEFRVWGSMIGSLMLRSIDKANIVYQAMELRGFNPDTFFIKVKKLDKYDILYLILGVAFLCILRWIPVFEWIGNIFL